MKTPWDQLERQFWPAGYRADIWMLVDAARQEQIFGKLLDAHLQLTCLYSRLIHPGLEIVAPYLVQLEFEDKNTRGFVEAAWGNSWGLFLKCDLGLQKTRRHLRTLLTVKDAAGAKLLFRYYDPRVLRAYLPTCTSEELKTVFGPIERFWCENRNGQELLEYKLADQKLVTTQVELAPGDPLTQAAAST